MRSSQPYVVEVSKVIGQGGLPGFIPLAHRHFQKALPSIANPQKATLIVSTDLLDLIVPDEILSGIESLEIVYEKTPLVVEK